MFLKQKNKWGLCLLGATLISFAMISAASAQSGSQNFNNAQQLQSQIQQLQNQVDTLNRSVYRGEAPPPSAGGSSPALLSAFEDRISALENNIRTLTGETERNSFEVQQMKERLERALGDMEVRLTALENGQRMSAASPATPSPATTGTASDNALTTAPQSPSPASEGTLTLGGTPETLYDQAFASVREARYGDAEQKFNSFIRQYPDHALTSNAYYWLAETHYARGDYQAAAKSFATGYKKYPKSGKAADSLLKLALSLSRLGKTQDACLSIAQLEKEFPNDTGPVMRRAKDEKANLKCK
jgi:tol-pal system protein YbgF